MASPQETAPQPACDRTQETVRRARLHLTEASNMLDSAATAITRASELAGERDSVRDELAEDIAALRGSARMLVDVLSE
jgi:hypothetical protein